MSKMKDMEDKLMMVAEIVKSEDHSELKVQMISEVIKVQMKVEAEEEETF